MNSLVRPLPLLLTMGAAITLAAGAYVAVDAHTNSDSLRSIAAEVQSAAPPEQAGALADGRVTLAEVNNAVAQAGECASAQGVQIELRRGSDKAPDELGFAVPRIADGEAARAILDGCKAKYVDEIRQLFSAQNRPDANELAAARLSLRACMAARGVEVPDAVTGSDISAWGQSRDPAIGGPLADCMDQGYRQLGFWP